jgi:hypothetical protein
MELIDKAAVVAEIEKLISNGKLKCQKSQEHNDQASYISWSAYTATCEKILSILDTLEVKEVNSTDALIEKATSYIQQHWIWNTKMIEDFKNYMKGE